MKSRVIKYFLLSYSIVITILAIWRLKETNSEISKLVQYNQDLDKENKELTIKISEVFLQRDSLKNAISKCN